MKSFVVLSAPPGSKDITRRMQSGGLPAGHAAPQEGRFSWAARRCRGFPQTKAAEVREVDTGPDAASNCWLQPDGVEVRRSDLWLGLHFHEHVTHRLALVKLHTKLTQRTKRNHTERHKFGFMTACFMAWYMMNVSGFCIFLVNLKFKNQLCSHFVILPLTKL